MAEVLLCALFLAVPGEEGSRRKGLWEVELGRKESREGPGMVWQLCGEREPGQAFRRDLPGGPSEGRQHCHPPHR